MLTKQEIEVCQELKNEAKVVNEKHPLVISLVERGYCKFSNARVGSLGVYTGEKMLSLTEAGEQALGMV